MIQLKSSNVIKIGFQIDQLGSKKSIKNIIWFL